MELKEAIDKLFEMTDEQRASTFGCSEVGDVLDSYHTETIIRRIEEYSTKPKYGDVYVDAGGYKFVVLDAEYGLSERYECPQKMSLDFLSKYYTKTSENVADKLKGLFE